MSTQDTTPRADRTQETPEAIFSGRAIVAHGPKDLRLETREARLGEGQVAVRVEVGGICGSDLHYYLHGGFGAVRLKAPMVLGHELAGTVMAIGPGVAGLSEGQRVAVNPSLPCDQCGNCRKGLRNHCTDMRFFGSAMRWPHVDGGFRDIVVCQAAQAVPLPDHVSFAQGALAEPLAVCLHAARQADSLAGKRVLITGAGPIGCLMVAAARLGGAADITLTDIIEPALEMGAALGADHLVNVGENPDGLAEAAAHGGRFEVHFEAAGSAPALLGALPQLAPRAISVLIGQGAEVPLQVSALIGSEIQLRGSFRFDEEFRLAVSELGRGLAGVERIVTGTLPAEEAVAAFDLATDKRRSTKVHLSFG